MSVRGYDLIDTIKSTLEQTCPGLVSCADIIVMATRDAVALVGLFQLLISVSSIYYIYIYMH